MEIATFTYTHPARRVYFPLHPARYEHVSTYSCYLGPHSKRTHVPLVRHPPPPPPPSVDIKANRYTNGIPNGVLCNYDVTITPFSFFSIVFESGIIPAEWEKCFISPIPKCSKKDPFLPLYYRGLSLLSCVGKLYSSILSNRIVLYTN